MKDNLLVNSLNYTFSEIFENKRRIVTQAKYQMRQQTLRTSLGIGWIFIRDLVYFTVFTIFRILVAGSGDVEGMSSHLYILLGLIPWNIMNQCVNGSVRTIRDNKHILSSLKLSVISLPIIDVIASFLNRAFTLLILLFAIMEFGDLKNITWWMLIYYYIAMFIFMVVWNLIFSSLIAISNDFEQLYSAITSVLIFTMPIMWSFDIMSGNDTLIRLFKLNPFVYIIEGFRDACHTGTLPDFEYTLYFWGFNLVLLCIGAILQYKLRRHYIDLI